MMYAATPRRASQAIVEIRTGARARKAKSAQVRMTRRMTSHITLRAHHARKPRRSARLWLFWWNVPAFQA